MPATPLPASPTPKPLSPDLRLLPRHSPAPDPSAKADIAGSLPRFQSPGTDARHAPPGSSHTETPLDGPSPPTPALARAGPAGEGRHHVFGAAISIAGDECPPRRSQPLPHRNPSRRTSAFCPGTRPHRTRRRRPTSRVHCRDFNRRVPMPATHRDQVAHREPRARRNHRPLRHVRRHSHHQRARKAAALAAHF